MSRDVFARLQHTSPRTLEKLGARFQHTEWTGSDAFKTGAALSGSFIAYSRAITNKPV